MVYNLTGVSILDPEPAVGKLAEWTRWASRVGSPTRNQMVSVIRVWYTTARGDREDYAEAIANNRTVANGVLAIIKTNDPTLANVQLRLLVQGIRRYAGDPAVWESADELLRIGGWTDPLPHDQHSTTTKGEDMYSITTARTIDGHVGQIQWRGLIVWQSEPVEEPLTKEDGTVIKTAGALAEEEAQAHLDEVMASLFETKTKKK